MQQNQVIQYRISVGSMKYQLCMHVLTHTHTCTTILVSTPKLPPQPQGNVEKTV